MEDDIQRVRIEREPWDFPISVWIVAWALWPILVLAVVGYILYQIIHIIFLLIFRPRVCRSYCTSLAHKWEKVVEAKLQKYSGLLIVLGVIYYIIYRIYKWVT